jgi:multiple antibiotic resistance protein
MWSETLRLSHGLVDRRERCADVSQDGAKMINTFLSFFAVAFAALLPVVNPVGSSLVFLGMVGTASKGDFRVLARKIAVSTALFLLAMDLAGAAVLKLFGISLPVVQLGGGLVLAAMGWELLNKREAPGQQDASPHHSDAAALQGKIFYPFTFPVTAGPGVLVVMLTLSAHASKGTLVNMVLAHLGVLAGMVLLCFAVFVFYGYAPVLATKISPSTAHGILRVVAFILFCIGVQIAWNGLSALVVGLNFFRR